jgi:hypothetical protein
LHPWSLTLRQFLERVEREFGARRYSLVMVGPQARAEIFFVTRQVATEHFAALLEIDPEDELTPSVLRSLCVQLGIPPEHFGLETEEPYVPPEDIN